MNVPKLLSCRPVVFVLALLSFACLIGQFYNVWTMRLFGCWVLPPATLLLILIAWWNRGKPDGLGNPSTWVVQGVVGGVISAVAYDLYRLPYVLHGAPLFKVFPRFGELLLGATEPRWAVNALGWAYHFSNGASLGIMFLTIASLFRRPSLFWGAVAWALFIETMLLLTPYPAFFGLKLNAWFIFLTLSAHLVFGVTLGIYYKMRYAARDGMLA